MLKKISILIIFILVIGVIAYWIKCQAGINLSDHYSLSRFRVFKTFQINKVMEYPKPGKIFSDSFDNSFHRRYWYPLWSAVKGEVKLKTVRGGLNGSRCLLVNNEGKQFWTYEFIQRIEVKAGDEFYFEGYIKNKGAEVKGGLGVTLLDKDENKISYNYAREEVADTEDWVKLSRRFTIPENGAYIQFRLSGINHGKSYFDDILLKKISSANDAAPE